MFGLWGSFLILSLSVGMMTWGANATGSLNLVWASPSSFSINWVAMGLSTTCMVAMTVMIISSSVMMYSASYMDSDMFNTRFSFLVISFISSMLVLVYSDSWTTLILGWDGLGLSSYFLVMFYLNPVSSSGGFITVISNRVGDVFIILFILMNLNSLYCGMSPAHSLYWASFVIFMAAITKSAMFPYMSWLPEAMAAPTPVSSLVHSSTLVTAGVFLLFQTSSWLIGPIWSVILHISASSLIVSSIVALLSQDLKKIVALSTLSQLSLMMVSLSLGLLSLGLFHMISHAMFKSCLFMSVGAIMHMSASSQEARVKSNKGSVTYSLMCVSLLCLCGAPFSSAYYTKESIILGSAGMASSSLMVALLVISAGATMMYSIKFVFAVTKGSKSLTLNASDMAGMHLFMLIMVTLSIITGGVLSSLINSAYPLNFNMLISILGLFILLLWLQLMTGTINPVHASGHFMFSLKSLMMKDTPLLNALAMMNQTKLWEKGMLNSSIAKSWVFLSKNMGATMVYMGGVVYSSYMSLFLMLGLMIMILY